MRIMKFIPQLALMGLFVSAFAGPDPRYRVYGPANFLGYKYPYRVGSAGYQPGADFLTLGKLDGNDVGPLAGMDETEITLRTALLRKDNPQVSTSYVNWLLNFKETYSQEVYESTMRSWIIGDSKTPFYMKDLLRAQLNAELPGLRSMLTGRIAELEGTPGKPLVVHVEVANEPNAFPYIPADLYAWYYRRWVAAIRRNMGSINSERAAAGKPAATFSVMPAGLWTWEGMPTALINTLARGFFAKINNIQIDAKVETSTLKYYNDFLAGLASLSTCDSKKTFTSNGGTIWTICSNPDDLIGVNVTKWEYIDNLGRSSSTKPTGALSYYYRPVSWSDLPQKNLIQIGNVHLYPYLGIHSSASLSSQMSSFSQLTSAMASNSGSGKVWITEMGNINPWSEDKVVADLMNPLFQHLSGSQFSQVERWYWFKNGGVDGKFAMFDDLPAKVGFQLKLYAYKIVNVVLDFVPGYDLPSIPIADTEKIYDFLAALKSTNPPQGLTSVSSPSVPTKLGKSYAKWAGAMRGTHHASLSLLLD